MTTRIGRLVLVVAGVFLITLTLQQQLFSRTDPFEKLTDDFRTELTDRNLQALKADLVGLAQMPAEVQTKLLPALAQRLGIAEEQLPQFMSTLTASYPAVMKGLSQIGTIVPPFGVLVSVMDEQKHNFEQADSIPTGSMPTTPIPWAFAFAGVVSIAAGVFGKSRRAWAIAAVVGLLLVAVPFAISMPSKAGAADDLNVALRPVMTQRSVTNATQGFETIKAMATEMQTKMLPGLAQQLQATPQQVQAFIGQTSPVLAQGLQSMPAALGRFDRVVTKLVRNVPRFQSIKPVSFTLVTWGAIATGMVMVASAWIAWAGSRTAVLIGEVTPRRRHALRGHKAA